MDEQIQAANEALSWVLGEQGNKCLKLMGTGEQRQFWGTRNKENQDFDFGEKGIKRVISENKGVGTPNLPGRASLIFILRIC